MTWPTTPKLPQPGTASPFIRRDVLLVFGNRAIADSNTVSGSGGSTPPRTGQLYPR